MIEGFKFGIGFVCVVAIACWIVYQFLQDSHNRKYHLGPYDYKYNKNEDELYLLGKKASEELRAGKNLSEVAKSLDKTKEEILNSLKRLTVIDEKNKDIELYEKVSS